MGAKNFVMVYNEIELGGEVKLHEHDAEHGYFVIEGKMLLRINDEKKEVNKDSAVYIPPKVKHGLKSIGDKKLRLLMIYSPPIQCNTSKFHRSGYGRSDKEEVELIF